MTIMRDYFLERSCYKRCALKSTIFFSCGNYMKYFMSKLDFISVMVIYIIVQKKDSQTTFQNFSLDLENFFREEERSV